MRETEGVKVALAQREREAHTLLGAHGENGTAILVAKTVGHAVHDAIIPRPRPARPPRPSDGETLPLQALGGGLHQVRKVMR